MIIKIKHICLGVFALLTVAGMGTIAYTPMLVDAGQSKFKFGSIDEIDSSDDINIGSLGQDTLVDEKPLIDVIKSITNWVLGILGLIALIMLIVGGIIMVTSAGTDRFEKGLTYVKYAAGGLVIIGVAWFIISLGFWLTREVAETATGSTAGSFD